MTKRYVFLAFVIGLLAVYFAGPAQAAAKVTPDTYYLETKTDANGNFNKAHGIHVATSGEGTIIVGMIVSVQNKTNKGWYTVYATGKGSRFAWDNNNVSGVISDPGFANQPVRVLIFTIHMLG